MTLTPPRNLTPRSPTMHIPFLISAMALLTLLILSLSFAQTSPPPADQIIAPLPDPFLFQDGSPVRTPQDWSARRTELSRLFQDIQYGPLPPPPQSLNIRRKSFSLPSLTQEDLELLLEHENRQAAMRVRVYIPQSAPAPVPAVIMGTFRPLPDFALQAVNLPEFLEIFPRRGYALALFECNQLALDDRNEPRRGLVYELFGQNLDTGALMAWAWGFHRTIDALLTLSSIDPHRLVVTGHSRYGKAALIAGALDPRIALTAPSHSGCAGAAPYRLLYGNAEKIENITGAFPHWFSRRFPQFVGRVDQLPFDQHLLMALAAPRALLCLEGTEDHWTNPQGVQATYLAAQEVFRFLGAPEKITIRYRPVGHTPHHEDLLDFADHLFFGKPLPPGFGDLPYPADPRARTWSAPIASPTSVTPCPPPAP